MTFVGSSAGIPSGRSSGRRLQSDYPVCDYSLIVRDNAAVASHTHNGAFAIGGTLTDATPDQAGTVDGHSYVHRTAPGPGFWFTGGYSSGTGFPFDWTGLEYLAGVIQPTPDAALNGQGGGYHVHVACKGGRYSLSNFYRRNPNAVAGRSGQNTSWSSTLGRP